MISRKILPIVFPFANVHLLSLPSLRSLSMGFPKKVPL